MRAVVLHPTTNERGGVLNAALTHAAGLEAVGVNVQFWTASPAAADVAASIGLKPILAPPIRTTYGPVLSKESIRAGLSFRDVDLVLHEGARPRLWAQLFWPGARHAVVFHHTKIGSRRFYSHWLALSSQHAQRLRLERTYWRKAPKVEVIKNGYLPSEPMREIASAGKKVTIGTLARLTDQKGLDTLIDSMGILRDKGIDAELRIGGVGAAEESLKAYTDSANLSQNVFFEGWVKPAEFLSKLDIFCLLSRVEPFGIVFLEAMRAQLPVVATKTDGALEIIEDRQTGYLVPIDDPVEAAHRLGELSKNRNAIAAMGARGAAVAEEKFGPKAVGESILGAFNSFGAQSG